MKSLVAMVLAAGLGTRLRPLSRFLPKPAVPLLNRPLIAYSFDFLTAAGVDETVVNLHHLPREVRRAVASTLHEYDASGRPSPTVHFSEEETVLGTAGGLRKAQKFLQGETVVVVNGKIYFEEDLRRILEFHRDSQSSATMVVVPFPPRSDFGPVWIDDSGAVRGFSADPGTVPAGDEGGRLTPYVFTGVQLLQREVLERIPEGFSDTVRDLYPRLMEEGRLVSGFVSRAWWGEFSTPRRYLENSLELLGRRGLENLQKAPLEAECHQVISGGDVRAERGCRLEDCILWNDIHIGRNSSLRNVIISSGVRLQEEVHLQNVVVTPHPRPPDQESLSGGWFLEDCFVRPLR